MNVTLTLFCVLCTRAHTFVQWGSFFICATLVFEKESLTEPGAQELTRLASEPPDPLSLCDPRLRNTGIHCRIWLLTGAWGSELRSSCSHSKHLPDWAISPPLDPLIWWTTRCSSKTHSNSPEFCICFPLLNPLQSFHSFLHCGSLS